MTLQLEVGKMYRRRNGEVVGPLEQVHGSYPFQLPGATLAIETFKKNGCVWDDQTTEHDLVEEVREPTYDVKHTADPVNSPAHYTQGGVECIDAIKAAMSAEAYKGFLRGNAIKYLWRYEHKGGAESLAKAQWYIERLKTEVEAVSA